MYRALALLLGVSFSWSHTCPAVLPLSSLWLCGFWIPLRAGTAPPGGQGAASAQGLPEGCCFEDCRKGNPQGEKCPAAQVSPHPWITPQSQRYDQFWMCLWAMMFTCCLAVDVLAWPERTQQDLLCRFHVWSQGWLLPRPALLTTWPWGELDHLPDLVENQIFLPPFWRESKVLAFQTDPSHCIAAWPLVLVMK